MAFGCCLYPVLAQQVIKSCRPTCIAFRLDRSATNCHRSGAFASLPSPWDLDSLDAPPCSNTSTTIFARGASTPLPDNLSIRIDESGQTGEVISSRFDLYGTDVVTHCSDYSCPECTSTDQMGSTLQVHFFPLGLGDQAPIVSFTLGLTLTFGGDPIGAFGSTRLGPLVPLWMDDPYFCRTRTASPSASPSFVESQSPSFGASSTPSMWPSVSPPSNTPSTLPPSVTQTEWPSILSSVVPTFHDSSGVPSSHPLLDPSYQPSAPEPTLVPSKSISTGPTEIPSRLPAYVPSIHPSNVPSTISPSTAPSIHWSTTPSTYSSATPSLQPKSMIPSVQPSNGSYIAAPTLPKAVDVSKAPTPYPTIMMFTGNALAGESSPTEEREPYRGKSFIVLVVGVVAFLASIAAVMKYVVDRRRARYFLSSFGSESSQGGASVISRARMDFARLAGTVSGTPTEVSEPSTTSSSEQTRRIGIIPVHSVKKGSKENKIGERGRSTTLRSSDASGLELVPSVVQTDSSSRSSRSIVLLLPSVVAGDWHSPKAFQSHDSDECMSVSTYASPPLSIGCDFSCSAGNSPPLQDSSSLPAIIATHQQRTLMTLYSVLEQHLAEHPHLSPKYPSQYPRHEADSPHLLQYRASIDETDNESEALSPSPYPNMLTIDDSLRSEAMSNVTESAPRRMSWGRFLNPLMETRPPGEENPDNPEDMGVYGSLLDQKCGLDSYSDVSLSYDSSSPIWTRKKATRFDEIDLHSDDGGSEYSSPYKDELQNDEREKESPAQNQDQYSASNLRRWLFPHITNKKSWLPVHSHFYGKE
jgi:hypothetical protein